jgi:hypothetical protein
VLLRTGIEPLADYSGDMIRPAPPAPFKTAFLTFLIAAVVALLVAQGASAAI